MAALLTRRTKAGGLAVLLIWVSVLLWAGCGKPNRGEVRTYREAPFPQKLSEWRLFVGDGSRLQPNKGVVPYDLNTPLFTDYADKHRFLWMPPGTAAVYHETEPFEFPVGTIISKTFAYPTGKTSARERLIETRLLVRTPSGWTGLPYIWNDEQIDATLELTGGTAAIEYTHASGKKYHIDYLIPNANQCKGCHENAQVMRPIGPKARHLNKDFPYPEGSANQIAYWARIGYLKNAPAPEKAPRLAIWDDARSGSLEARARAYLDIQCAHCHNPAGPANTSGLDLSATATGPGRLGVFKSPVAAGKGSGGLWFDVVPGDPEASILIYRMQSTEPKVMMPELGRTIIHSEGVALLREWIASMKGRL